MRGSFVIMKDKRVKNRYGRGELAYEILEGLLGGAMLSMMIIAALSGGGIGFHRRRKVMNRETNKNDFKEKSLYETLRRLKQQGMITKRGDKWTITNKGKGYIKKIREKNIFWGQTRYPKEKSDEQIIFIFDIPEKLRSSRKLVRSGLLALDFSMLQKSVWIGQVKIPKEFLRDLTDWNVISYIHIFSVKKEGTLKK